MIRPVAAAVALSVGFLHAQAAPALVDRIEVVPFESPCLERGATIAHDRAATGATVKAVKDLVAGLGAKR